MDFEDSRLALFPEPNAYIKKFEKKEKPPQKIVFQEPYECIPTYYINNNFKKENCNCVPSKSKNKNSNNCDCNSKNQSFNNTNKQKGFGFDLKSLMPLLSIFNKGSGADLSNIVGLLNNDSNVQNDSQSSSSSPINLISGLLSNKDVISNVLNIFKGGKFDFFNKKQTTKKQPKTTDFEIKHYTRVE